MITVADLVQPNTVAGPNSADSLDLFRSKLIPHFLSRNHFTVYVSLTDLSSCEDNGTFNIFKTQLPPENYETNGRQIKRGTIHFCSPDIILKE